MDAREHRFRFDFCKIRETNLDQCQLLFAPRACKELRANLFRCDFYLRLDLGQSNEFRSREVFCRFREDYLYRTQLQSICNSERNDSQS
jgi:hypothetical protein